MSHTNKLKWLISLLCIGLILLSFSPVFAQETNTKSVNIYFFWGDGCPHCAEEEPFLKSLVSSNTRVNLVDYEVWYHKDNQKILEEFSSALGFEPSGVPVTVIGERYWIGFSQDYEAEMKSALQATLADPDPVDIGARLGLSAQTQPAAPAASEAETTAGQTLTLPLIGKVDLSKESLTFSTIVIGFVDGFNPCSLWVLSVLLALTLHSGSRKKILAVGLTYLIVTTIVYSLFITGVFTLLSYVGYLKWIQIGVALIALVFGIVNLKDYFWYKEGLSFTISDKHKPKLYQNMRSTVTDTSSMLGLIGSSAALAVGVSFIEFSCTAGFPVIWSNLIAANQVKVWQFILLLGLYMFIYLLDEMAVFISAAVTMRASRVEEKHGRLLKLISGVLMTTLALVMIINPQWMNGVGSSILVFAAALAITMVIYVIHRKVLPKFGILIGSELQPGKARKHRKP